MKILPLFLISAVVGMASISVSVPAAQAQSPRFEYAPHYWEKDQSTGGRRRRGYNNLAPLVLQNVPSGKTVSAQNMTGVDFANLPKRSAVAPARTTAVNSVASDSGAFGKPNVPAAARAGSIRPGLPMTAMPELATTPAKPIKAASKSTNALRNISGKRLAKLPTIQSYPQGAGYVSGSTAPALYGVNTKARISVGGKLLPKH